jgi:hypothetical protein
LQDDDRGQDEEGSAELDRGEELGKLAYAYAYAYVQLEFVRTTGAVAVLPDSRPQNVT